MKLRFRFWGLGRAISPILRRLNIVVSKIVITHQMNQIRPISLAQHPLFWLRIANNQLNRFDIVFYPPEYPYFYPHS